ncbi:mitochondrial ribosomal protein subunit L20-domain-containing protein [Mycotypha africana]|uniref:mitochondrial ribosomal protein subunit L20-domain-containing protein n=1 Tax=Mycotypha africana TaxID=64632 RepID=UPI002300BE21|nr:mitochondrial ribosomal protein subunit L20-domain-containing protein [Mycotypha africana]KAI8967493.1 mitochondrial ribosomal protein subunit L20-domain-containing protein [Mycotypha africana]
MWGARGKQFYHFSLQRFLSNPLSSRSSQTPSTSSPSTMNRTSAPLYRSIRTYATKSKTPNMKMKPSVPIKETALPNGTVFVERLPVVEPTIQASYAPLLHRNSTTLTTTKKLTESEIAEMRQLRQSDPSTWTRSKLAEKFGCSPLFVSMAAPLPKDILQQHQEEQKNAANSTMRGYRRKLITEQRQKRRELW